MKEAAGEANMTVITIVLIGVVAAVGLLLVPRLMQNAKAKACCTDGGWYVSGNLCKNPEGGATIEFGSMKSGNDSRGQATIFSACMAD